MVEQTNVTRERAVSPGRVPFPGDGELREAPSCPWVSSVARLALVAEEVEPSIRFCAYNLRRLGEEGAEIFTAIIEELAEHPKHGGD